jgi:hypothetical protein
MSDFFPKLQEAKIDFSSIQVPLNSTAGMVEAARGKIKPIEKKADPKAESAKDSKAGSKVQEKPDQSKKPQEKPQDKQNPKDKKK